VHLTIKVQSSDAQRLFDHPVKIQNAKCQKNPTSRNHPVDAKGQTDITKLTAVFRTQKRLQGNFKTNTSCQVGFIFAMVSRAGTGV
jgi:hypothetical protein